MNASDVMRASVASIQPAAPLVDAVQLLLETNQRALPVVDGDGQLVGIISEGDFLHRVELGSNFPGRTRLTSLFRPNNQKAIRERMRALRVEQVMTRKPAFVDEEASLDEVVAQMDARRVSQLPVVCGGVVIGMISRRELLSVVERSLRKARDSEEDVSAA